MIDVQLHMLNLSEDLVARCNSEDLFLILKTVKSHNTFWIDHYSSRVITLKKLIRKQLCQLLG